MHDLRRFVGSPDHLLDLLAAAHVGDARRSAEDFAEYGFVLCGVDDPLNILEAVHRVDVGVFPLDAGRRDVFGGLVEVDRAAHATFGVDVVVEFDDALVGKRTQEQDVELCEDGAYDRRRASPHQFDELLRLCLVGERLAVEDLQNLTIVLNRHRQRYGMIEDALFHGFQPLRTEDSLFRLIADGRSSNSDVVLTDDLLEVEADSRGVPVEETLEDYVVEKLLVQFRGGIEASLYVLRQCAKD